MKTHKTRLAALAASAAIAGLLAGGAQAADPIKIGASLPLTGNFSVSGTKHQQGYQLCVDLINAKGGVDGRQLDLIISDNRSDTETAISQYERFVNADKVDILFGTFSSKLSFPVSSVLEKYGMVHPVPAGGALRIWSQGHKNMFYFQQDVAELMGSSLTNMIAERIPADQRPKTAALVKADDFFANGIAAGLAGGTVSNPGGGIVADLAPGFLKEIGVELVMEETWPEEGFSDWLNLANSIKQANPDLVIGLTASAEEAVQLTRALQTVKAQPKFLFFSQGTQSEYKTGTGAAAEGVMMPTSWHPAVAFVGEIAGGTFTNADFVAAFTEKFGNAPDEDSAIPFAVCQGMEQAMRGTGSTENAKLSDWLHARTKADPVKTVLGPFSWDERGVPEDRSVLVAQWQGDDLKFIYPTNEFEGVATVVFPKPQW
jgi:branched-chain amino acid transport system substrate-binding protein